MQCKPNNISTSHTRARARAR